MAPVHLIIIIIIAVGLHSVVIAVPARPPPSSGAAASTLHWDSAPWRRLEEDDDADPAPDHWSSGFGQRLTVQRRVGSSSTQPEVIEASTKLISVTRQLRPKPLEATTAASSVITASSSSAATTTTTTPPTTVRSILRNRLQENRTKLLEETPVRESAPLEDSLLVPPVMKEELLDVVESATAQPVEDVPSSTSTTTTEVTSTTSSTTTTTAAATPVALPSSEASRPPWRIRMEQNHNNRRQPSTAKQGNEAISSPPLPVLVLDEFQNGPAITIPAAVVTLEPSLTPSTTASSILRPVIHQSSRISPTFVRITPVTTARLQTTSTTTSEPQLAVLDQENDVKDVTTPFPSTSSTTRTQAPTVATVPTPMMHSLEDILQRLVPAREDSNPFLAAGGIHRQLDDRNSSETVYQPEETNEIVTTVIRQLPSKPVTTSNSNSSGNANKKEGDPAETQPTTSVYIVAVVAVIPLAGVILWVVRVQLHKRRERLNESETSSETGFRKTRLPPVALSPSKAARLFYGANDKEDLVPSSTSPTNGGRSPSPWEFSRSRLRLQTLIGEGNFGQVWKAEAEDICGCQGTLLVAVKTVKDGASGKEKQELLREMRIMQQMGPHPNVVALLGCCTEQEPFLLIMEYVMYGRLLTFLREHRSQQTYYNYSSDSEALTSRDLTTFAYCVAKGMEYIYSHGVVHRDLAARNVLVDHNKLCKVADFGLSRSVRDTAGEMYEQRVKGALPIRWMSPESLTQSVFTQKSDVWSFGVLVWEIVTLGSTPYPGMEAREVMRRVKEGHRLDRPSHCRPEFYRLMSRCWHPDPQRRPDFGELKAELGRLLDDAEGYIDLDNFQESQYVPLESPSDESEKV